TLGAPAHRVRFPALIDPLPFRRLAPFLVRLGELGVDEGAERLRVVLLLQPFLRQALPRDPWRIQGIEMEARELTVRVRCPPLSTPEHPRLRALGDEGAA